MASSLWQPFRISLLALTLGGILWGLFQAILFPNQGDERPVNSFVFPTTVPLPEWQMIKATPLKAEDDSHLKDGQQYQYRQNSRRLDIEARYEIYTDGNVSRLLVVYTPIQPATVNLKIKYQEGVGFYGVFRYQKRAYLSACINPQGDSTVTEQQFVRNRYTYGLSFNRILFWALGQNDLFDGRCLWTLLSIPVAPGSNSNSLEETDQILETTWFDWYRWWQPRFPPS